MKHPTCRGTGLKVATRATGKNADRSTTCVACGRRMAINYDGRIRRHSDMRQPGAR